MSHKCVPMQPSNKKEIKETVGVDLHDTWIWFFFPPIQSISNNGLIPYFVSTLAPSTCMHVKPTHSNIHE